MSEVKLEKTKQKKLKGASKAIYVIAKIGRVFTIIGVAFMILGIAMGIGFVNSINLKDDNTIEMKYNDASIQVRELSDDVEIVSNGESVKLDDAEATTAIKYAINILKNNSKTNIMLFLIITAAFTIASMVLLIIILKRVEELFRNIHDNDTPFTVENIDLIKKITYFMIAATIVPIVGNMISSLFMPTEAEGFDMNFGYSLIAILAVYCLGFVFEYGYEIQQNANSRIYGDDNNE